MFNDIHMLYFSLMFYLYTGFPNAAVIDAYMNPTVDDSMESFTWAAPDIESLREYPFMAHYCHHVHESRNISYVYFPSASHFRSWSCNFLSRGIDVGLVRLFGQTVLHKFRCPPFGKLWMVTVMNSCENIL